MPRGQLDAVARHIRHLAGTLATQGLNDADLLERFVSSGDEAAFAALVERHGGLVWSVCRHVLGRPEDVEDAFQATFLVLIRKAASVRKRGAVASWLYGVAYRTAMKAKKSAARRREYKGRPQSRTAEQPASVAALQELQAMLDQEVQRLPDKYRAPFLLCCLEGKSRAEAARELGWKEGTVAGRLAQARKQLLGRLARRGVALSTALCASALSGHSASAEAPATLAVAIVRAAAGETAGAVSAQAIALAESVLKGMAVSKTMAGAALLLTLGILAGGVAARQAQLSEPPRADWPKSAERAAGRPKPEGEKQARTDLFGDPLPPGALVRMETVRLRQASPQVMFSPDGKALFSAGVDHMVRTWDVATGKYLRGKRLEGTQHLDASAISFAPDGKALVVWAFNRKSLLIYEAATGNVIGSVPRRDAQLCRLALGPGGKVLATATDDTVKKHFIRLWDVATGAERLLLEHDRGDEDLVFSPDSKFLAAAGRDDTVRLWDVATGKLLHNLRADAECVAFSPDGKTVAADNSDRAVNLWNVVTGKEQAVLRATPRHDVQCLAFSPDGKVLAVGGQRGLRLWDVAARKQLRQLPDRMVYWMTFAPDGKVLAASGGSNIRLWDVATGKQLLDRPGHDDQVDAITVSPDGRVLASTSYSDSTLCLWDASTGKLLHRPTERGTACRFTCFSPDSKLVASGGHDGFLHLWETATGKEWRRFTIEELEPEDVKPFVDALGLSADGRRLVAVTRGGGRDGELGRGQISVWDTTNGKLLKRRMFDSNRCPCFQPDADGVTVRTSEGLAIQDTFTGKKLMTIPGVVDMLPIAFSPDGKLVAVVRRPVVVPAAGKGAGFAHAAGDVTAVSVAEVATGREVVRVETGPTHCLAFSEDGRVLATADNHVVRLWEVATGKEIFHQPRHEELPGTPAQAAVTSVALLPGGRALATGHEDGTILVWDLAPDTVAAKEPSHKELDGLWSDLAGDDARKAYGAIHILTASPAPAIAYLKEHLQPVAEIELKRVERLLADLDSERFAVRHAAAKELAQSVSRFEPTIRRALEGKPSLEVRRRLEALLAAPHRVPPGTLLRALRAIQILEQIGTLEARQVLQKLGRGAPEARLTREAKASLERLAKRPTVMP